MDPGTSGSVTMNAYHYTGGVIFTLRYNKYHMAKEGHVARTMWLPAWKYNKTRTNYNTGSGRETWRIPNEFITL
jgi:hypothetical protein